MLSDLQPVTGGCCPGPGMRQANNEKHQGMKGIRKLFTSVTITPLSKSIELCTQRVMLLHKDNTLSLNKFL